MTSEASRIISATRAAGLFLDTNLLLLLLVGRYDETLIVRFKRTDKYSVDDFTLLERLVPLFSRIVTSPHVLAETNSLLNQLAEPARGEVLQQLARHIETADERFIAAVKCCSDVTFARFGLTDVVSKEICVAGPLLLTDDFRLSQTVAAAGISALNFNHIRMLGWAR